jgi:hypothetical protein
MSTKKELGQFYTTNADALLKGLILPKPAGIKVVEPFVGQGDLVEFCKQFGPVDMYDIDPKIPDAICRDTIKNPPNYDNSYCITNPPYLARNKSPNKEIFDLYDQNDLYKCFLTTIIDSGCLGGILIIPLNFWSGLRASDVELRIRFLTKFKILQLNIFEDAAFDDTNYSVCSFSFVLNSESSDQNIPTIFYPSEATIKLELSEPYYVIGQDILTKPKYDFIDIRRLTDTSGVPEGFVKSNIKLYALDAVGPDRPGFKNGCIRLEFVEDNEITKGKGSDRTFACFIWNVNLTKEAQQTIVRMFNNYLSVQRKKYYSLFLSNYREGQRKRITFELATNLLNTSIGMYCIKKKIPVETILRSNGTSSIGS